jgi:hypothetical protein
LESTIAASAKAKLTGAARLATIWLGLLIVLGPFHGSAHALPQFSLVTGNRCVNCHVNAQGGGLRDELGRYSMEETGLIRPERNPLRAPNALWNGKVLIGADARVQMARSHVSPDASRRFFPMQASVYGAYEPASWMQLEGSYNAGPKKYDGQRTWSASVLIQPSFLYPQIRAGHFQPSVGIRYDDHTMLVRQVAEVSGGSSLIAPNYAEYGIEALYNRLRWLSLTVGIHRSSGLAENSVVNRSGQRVSVVGDKEGPSYLGRIVLWPRAARGLWNFYLGGSGLVNGDFQLLSLFGGAGLRDRGSFMSELTMSKIEGLRRTRNLSVDLAWQARESLVLYLRGDLARTTHPRANGTDVSLSTRQAVLGAQVFLMPGIEFRPEYRLMDTETFRSVRYALQLHVFY